MRTWYMSDIILKWTISFVFQNRNARVTININFMNEISSYRKINIWGQTTPGSAEG